MPSGSTASTGRSTQAGVLAALRHAIRGIEGRHLAADAAAGLTPLGIATVDAALGGGLPGAALHEIAAAREAEIAAATGFALALARGVARTRAVLWIAEDMTQAESGALYGPGLDEAGVQPEQLIVVTAAHARDVFWAMEEALRCCAVGAVIGELRRQSVDDLTGRRLSLAALQHKSCALLLRAQPDTRPLAAATRWVIGAAPARQALYGTGPPALTARLARNRHGLTGSWVLEWNRAEQRFDLASAHPQPVAAAPADRPRGATTSA
jgi:protein ImuA